MSWLLAIVGFMLTTPARAQALTDSTTQRTHAKRFALVMYVGGGLSVYSAPLGIPASLGQRKIYRLGVPATLRVLWQTDHRLRLGIESGWTTMYAYRGQSPTAPARVYVSAVPALVVWSMPVSRRLALFAGVGGYRIQTSLQYEGRVDNSTISLGWMAAGSYTYPISRQVGLAAELKWYDATTTDDAAFSAQLQLVWKFKRW